MKWILLILILAIALFMKGDILTVKIKPKQLANPASVKCIEDGYKLEIRKDEDGGEYGVCIDQQGRECDEWKYFKGECKLGNNR